MQGNKINENFDYICLYYKKGIEVKNVKNSSFNNFSFM